MLSRFSRRTFLLTLAFGLLFANPGALPAQQKDTAADLPIVQAGSIMSIESGAAPKKIELSYGEEVTLQLNKPIQSVLGFNTSMLDVSALRSDMIRIGARGPGQTTLLIKDDQDTLTEVAITVKNERPGKLRTVLDELYPEAKLQLYELSGAMLVRGTVRTPGALHEITDIARQFYPSVLPYITVEDAVTVKDAVAPKTESVQIPAGMRVVSFVVTNSQDEMEKFSPRDRVDVLVTYSVPSGDGTLSKRATLMQDVELFATATDSGFQRASLLVRPDESGHFALAERRGKLSLVPGGSQPATRVNEAVAEELRGRPSRKRETRPQPEVESDLQSDLRALHADVKRLIDLLEQRQSSTKTDPKHSAPSHEYHAPPSLMKPAIVGAAPSSPQHAQAVADRKAGEALPPGRHVLFFYADWATQSLRMLSLVDRIAREEAVKVSKVNVKGRWKDAVSYGVTAVPTLLFIADRKEVERIVDSASEDELRQLMRRVKQPEYDYVWNALGLRLAPNYPPQDKTLAEENRSRFRTGMVVTEVSEGSPHPGRTGLEIGDVIVGMGLLEMKDISAARIALKAHSRTDEDGRSWIKFHAVREGKSFQGELRVATTTESEEQGADDGDDDIGCADDADDGTVLLYFDAKWCGPCQKMVPVIREIAEEGIVPVRTVDVDKDRALAEKHNINSIPALVLLRDGEEVDRILGTVTAEQIRTLIGVEQETAVSHYVGFAR